MDNPSSVSKDTDLIQAGREMFFANLSRIKPVIKTACPELLLSIDRRMVVLVNTFSCARSKAQTRQSTHSSECSLSNFSEDMAKQKTIPFYHWRPEHTTISNNFGDHCVPTIIASLLPKDINLKFSKTAAPGRLVSIGSLLGNSNKIYGTDIIWGTGFMYRGRKASAKSTVKMTRGPLSQLQFEASGVKCPSVYGDPGIFMPYAFGIKKSEEPKKHELGIIPHFHDIPKAKQSI